MPPPKSAAPTRIGRYLIKRTIDVTNSATVYWASDPALRREVALKVLHPELVQDPEWVKSFRMEAQLTASLSSEHIVQIHDIQKPTGSLYAVMEYLPASLETLLRQEGGQLSAEKSVRLAQQIARALAYAHDQGVVHRDLKPSHVLLTPQGRVKLIDFGVAQADTKTEDLARAARDSSENSSGEIVGTHQYMSPEQALGERAAPRSDLFALGVILCKMLTGHTPLDLLVSNRAVLDHHRAGRPMPYKDLLRDAAVPPGLVAVVGRCLEIDPSARYQSVEEFLAALESYDRAPAPAPPPVPRLNRLTGLVAAHRRLALSGSGAALLALAAIIVALILVPGGADNPPAAALPCTGAVVNDFTVNGLRYPPDSRVTVQPPPAGGPDLPVVIHLDVAATPDQCQQDLEVEWTQVTRFTDGRELSRELQPSEAGLVRLGIPDQVSSVIVQASGVLESQGTKFDFGSRIWLSLEEPVSETEGGPVNQGEGQGL